MLISERIFNILSDKKMTQKDFADQVGIANSTVSEWKKKKTNPSADKIMDICKVLDITPDQLLTGTGIDDEEKESSESKRKYTPLEHKLVEDYHTLSTEQQRRLMAYLNAMKTINKLESGVNGGTNGD